MAQHQRISGKWLLATAAGLLAAQIASAQTSSGLGSSSSSGSSMSGGSLGSSSGSSGSSGGFLGSSGSTSGSGTSSGTSSSFLGSSGSFLNLGTAVSNTNRTSTTTYNAFSSYFVNPMAVGWPGGTTSQAGSFGTPLVGSLSTGNSGTATLMRGGAATFTPTTTGIYSMIGQRRSPTYTASLGFPYRPPAPSQIEPRLQQIIAGASSLPSRGNIRVSMDGRTVVLRGSVSDDHERRLAESVLRLSPGVRDVRNELTVPPASASAVSLE